MDAQRLKRAVHIVGIGGAGMSAIARVLLGRGVRVSGSDRSTNDITQKLQALGATIYEGHAAGQIAGAETVLISSAVKDDNPEVMAARADGIPVLKRREALPLLMGDAQQICVAGTHGKTTTTALITHLLRETGRDPSYIVGGVMANTGDNAHAGTGEAFVIEADEYDYMFLGLRPTIAVITNIEHDHPDMFPTLNDVLNAFRQFIAQIPPFDGLLVACTDDPNATLLARERRSTGQPTALYGLRDSDQSDGIEWTAIPGDPVSITGWQWGQRVQAQVALPDTLKGDHNVRNLLAALAAVCAAGVTFQQAVDALHTFKGTGRRFEVLGVANGVTLISDYGHHPTAISATLQMAKQRYPGAELWAVWQPHTFSRTRLLADEFAHAFQGADHALVIAIYAARETQQPGDLDGAAMAARIAATGHPDARYSGDLSATADMLRHEARSGQVVILFSAGDAPKIATMLLKA